MSLMQGIRYATTVHHDVDMWRFKLKPRQWGSYHRPKVKWSGAELAELRFGLHYSLCFLWLAWPWLELKFAYPKGYQKQNVCMSWTPPIRVQSMQIKSFPWRLAIASNLVAEIIISEVLGYHASVEVVSPIFTDAIESFGCSTDCETNHGTDILFEVWLTEVAQFFADFQSENPQVVEDLGSMGYEASSGMYMKGSVREHAESDSGLPLEYYKSYNLSLNQSYRYFDTIWDLNASELLACTAQHSDLMNPSKMKNFLDWTGDVEGVQELTAVQW